MEHSESITTKEKLIEFILDLTDLECEYIISNFNKIEKEQA